MEHVREIHIPNSYVFRIMTLMHTYTLVLSTNITLHIHHLWKIHVTMFFGTYSTYVQVHITSIKLCHIVVTI